MKVRKATMSNNSKNGCTVNLGGGALLFGLPTAMIGYHIHGSVFWAIMDFFFWAFAWLKWIICQEVNVSIIKATFSWFFQ